MNFFVLFHCALYRQVGITWEKNYTLEYKTYTYKTWYKYSSRICTYYTFIRFLKTVFLQKEHLSLFFLANKDADDDDTGM